MFKTKRDVYSTIKLQYRYKHLTDGLFATLRYFNQ